MTVGAGDSVGISLGEGDGTAVSVGAGESVGGQSGGRCTASTASIETDSDIISRVIQK